MTSPLKDPKGGLTQAGREYFRRKEGAHLKPGVKGSANTPEKMRRKGSFLRRFYGRKQIPPLTTASGKPTRYALAAHAWGEKVPTSMSDVKRLAAKGTALLKRYQATRKDNPVDYFDNPERPRLWSLVVVDDTPGPYRGDVLGKIDNLPTETAAVREANDFCRMHRLEVLQDRNRVRSERRGGRFVYTLYVRTKKQPASTMGLELLLMHRQQNPVISRPLFGLGRVVATRGVMAKVSSADIQVALTRHITGDWGKMDEEDRAANNRAIRSKGQILSTHRSSMGVAFWVITDPGHEITTVLLPEEY